jgi:ketosteroid isomerase-like protein
VTRLQYHFVFVLKDGRISVIKEYMNPAAARAAWVAVGAA